MKTCKDWQLDQGALYFSGCLLYGLDCFQTVVLRTPAACCCSTLPSNMQKKKDSFPGLQEVLVRLEGTNNWVHRLPFKPSPQPPTAASLVSGQMCSIVNVCAKQHVSLNYLKLMRATVGAGSGG